MRSLFLKIFFWFWLAMALMGLALLAVTWTMRLEPVIPAQSRLISDALEENATNAAWRLENRGLADLTAYLRRMEKKAQVRAYFFDASGRKLAGSMAVPGAKELARAASSRDEVEFQLSGRDVLMARRAVGKSGKVYVLVASMPRSILSALRVKPETRVIRITLMLLVAGAVCFALARNFAIPVVKLRDATRRFAAGDLSVRVSPGLGRRRDELADLARDFDAMATQISSLLTAQQRLIGDVSHELRTPLTRLNLALELARRHAGEGAAPALDRIEREAGQLNTLIGQLLALSRLESGDARPSQTLLDLRPMLANIIEDAQLEATARHRKVELAEGETCIVRGIPDVLCSAVQNVVSNALRHTPEHSVVEVALRCEADRATISVRDHGPGVPEEALTEIFRPFYRVDDARDREGGGSGLGLAIVERAVTSHGGMVQAMNAPDGGLIVEIKIPGQKQEGH